MNNKIIANKINAFADEILAKANYVYDPDHKNKPRDGGNWHKTEKGWSKKETTSTGAGSSNLKNKFDLADSEATDPKDLDKLSRDKEYTVRYKVACNPNTSAETLKNMYDAIEDPIGDNISDAIAKHRNTSKEIQIELAQAGILDVKDNPNAAPEALHEILDTMENHEAFDTYYKVLENDNVASEDVDWVAEKYMAHDSDIDDRDMMEYLKNNAMAVINHPNVTSDTLKRLTGAHDREVAIEAKRALKTKTFNDPKH